MVPSEISANDLNIKYAPMVGEWYVVSPKKVSQNKRKQLQILGYTVVDMTDYAPNERPFSVQDIDHMLAIALTGLDQPVPLAKPREGSKG